MEKKIGFILFILTFLNLTHILDFMIMMPLGNHLIPFLHIKPSQFSFLVSVYAISAAISSILSAFYVNQFDRKKVLIFAYIGFLIGTFTCGLAQDYNFLLLSRIVAGLFGGIIGSQVIAIISDLVHYEKRGYAMGVLMSSFAVASTIGVPIALKLSNSYSWHSPFFLVSGMGVFVLLLIFFGLPSMSMYIQKDSKDRLKVIRVILADKTQILALFFSFSMFFGHFIIIPFINPYLEFNKGFSKNITPEVYLYGGLASFFASFFFGIISDKIGKLNTFFACTLLSLPLVIIVTHLPNLDWKIVLIIFSSWFLFATGRTITAQSLISNVSPPEYRGSFQSFNSFVQQMGYGLSALLSGFIIKHSGENSPILNYNFLGYISVLILIIAIVIALNIFRKIDKA